MKIAIETKNKDKICEALAAINGKAREHTFSTYAQIFEIAQDAEILLTKLVNKCDAVGAVYTATSGDKMPNSYKYVRIATKVILTRGSKGWFLTDIKTDSVWSSGGSKGLTLTTGQDSKAVERLRLKYKIDKHLYLTLVA
jgi:hypothetical protein